MSEETYEIKLEESDETKGFTIYYKDAHIEVVEYPEKVTVRQLFSYLKAVDEDE